MKTALKMIPVIAMTLLLAQPAASYAEGTPKAPATAAAAPSSAEKPTMESKDFQTWRMECLIFKNGKKVCQMFQRLVAKDKDQKKHMLLAAKAGIVPEKGKDGKMKDVARLMIITPLGTLLPAKLGIKLDGEKESTVPFLTCAPEGCMVDLALEGVLLDKIKAGKKLHVAYKRMMSDKQITLDIDLAGFADGLKALAGKQG